MKSKKFFFLCGLPRAGNTLLTSILNQNLDIACTPNGFTTNIVNALKEIPNTLEYRNAPNEDSYNNILKNIYPMFYKHWKQKYIIERGVASDPVNFEYLLNYLDKNLKVIFLFRPVLEVLASFIVWSKNNPNNFLDNDCSTKEEICEKLMRPDGIIMKNLSCMANLMVPCNKKNGLIINYSDLVKDTAKTVNKIYSFLNIPKFKHSFKNLKQIKINNIQYDDSVVGHNLHMIKTKDISFTQRDIKKVLGDKLIKKYSDVQIRIIQE